MQDARNENERNGIDEMNQLELNAVSTSNAPLRQRLYEENLALVKQFRQERDELMAEVEELVVRKSELDRRLEQLNEDIERLTVSIDRHAQAAWRNA